MMKMKKRGFTLIELILVVAIVGLLSSMAVPRFLTTLNNARENADATHAQGIINAFYYAAMKYDGDVTKVKSDDFHGEAGLINIIKLESATERPPEGKWGVYWDTTTGIITVYKHGVDVPILVK